MDESKGLLLPFYVLVDVSWSMTQSTGDSMTGIDAVNAIAPEVANALDENPLVRDKIRFGMVDFSGDARVVIPLCDLGAVDHIPRLEARTDGTSYATAFRKMREQIENDVQQLKSDNYKVHRPAVFFLTDGEPTDATDADWQQAFAALTAADFRARPNFIPFGVRDAKKTVLDQLVHPTGRMRSFLAAEGTKASDAIRSMIELLISSIIESGKELDEEGEDGGFVLPEPDDDDDKWI